jgi:CBS domain-containing protein
MKIGEVLLKQGLVDEASIEKALKIQGSNYKALGETLIDIGVINETNLNDALVLQISLKAERLEDKIHFLESIMPFSSLNIAEIEEIVTTMAWEHFPPDEFIIKQGIYGSKFYLIKSGLVKVYLDQEGKEVVLGFLGEGDCFGEMSLLTNAPTTSNVQTVEFTLCLAQDKDTFFTMVQKYPMFLHFFNQLLTHRMKTVYKELLTTSPGIAQVEPFLYRKQVKDLMSPLQVFGNKSTTIQEAARELVEKKASAFIVQDDENNTKGILGLNEIVKTILLEGGNPQQTVDTIMEDSYQTIDAESYFFDALHEMVKHKTNKLVVLDREKTAGILTGYDLLRFRGREVLSLLKNIEDAENFEELDIMRREVEKVLRALMADGALASNACKIVSEFNDKITRKVIGLAEKELGMPPVAYAWLGLGSEGRKEQTLLTDQDNAIVLAKNSTPEIDAYFKKFSDKVVQGLNQCGFPLCKGNVMATNPKYFGELKEWKGRTAGWIKNQDLPEKELIDIYVFLDFRTIYGNYKLEKELKSHMIKSIKENPQFSRSLAQNIINVPVPLGFFKNFVVEKSGKYKNTVNIKNFGLLPLTTCIKLLALQQGIHETNTLERIKTLQQNNIFSIDQAEFLEQAFETLLTLKIKNNLNDIDQKKDLGNYIDPATLTTKQKQLLKEAFLAVSQLQKTTRNTLKVEDQELSIN